MIKISPHPHRLVSTLYIAIASKFDNKAMPTYDTNNRLFKAIILVPNENIEPIG